MEDHVCQSHNKYKMIFVAFHNFSFSEKCKKCQTEKFHFLTPSSPAIPVTTIQRDLREVDFTAALLLVSTGSYHRDARYIMCCLYEEV